MENTAEFNVEDIISKLGEGAPAAFNLDDYLIAEKKDSFSQNFFSQFGTTDMNGLVSKVQQAEELQVRLAEIEANRKEVHPLLESFSKHVEGLGTGDAIERIKTVLKLQGMEELNGEDLAIRFLKYQHPSYTKEEIQDLMRHKVYANISDDTEGAATIKKAALEEFNKVAKSEIDKMKVSLETNVSGNLAAAESEQRLTDAMSQISQKLVPNKVEYEGVNFEIEGKDEYANALATYLKTAYNQDKTIVQDPMKLKEMSDKFIKQIYFASNYESVITQLKESFTSQKTQKNVQQVRSNTPPPTQTPNDKANWRKAFGL